jgi:hypothetical protein
VDSSRNGDNLVWRIGKPDITMSGTHEYVIHYSVLGAIGRFKDFDELYWNISGEGWDAPLPLVTATVSLPAGVKATQSACYTGPYGSKEQACEIVPEETRLRFVTKKAGDPMTVAVGFPKGAVAETAPVSNGTLPSWVSWLWWLLPILTLLFMYRRWKKKGDDPALGAIVVQFEAPAGVRPVESTSILRMKTDEKAVAATIVDCAVRGFIRIEETKTEGFLGTGLGSSKDHILHLLKDFRQDTTLKPFERMLLEALFIDQPPAQVRISELVKRKFYADAKAFRTGVMAYLVSDGYFEGDPEKARIFPLTVGIILMVLSVHGIFSSSGPIHFWGALFLTGAVIAAFGHFMSKWSPKGLEAARHLRGYQEFISKVEKYRAPWMETQDIFEKTLPYAMAFGLGTRWAKAFSSLNLRPPDWYTGVNAGTWSAMSFANDLDSWSKSMVAASSPPRSSGSGSGGGGFSGGGGGGGGGGSW